MISVINKFEIDRNPSASADLSFFPMESSQTVESRDSSDPETRDSAKGDLFDSSSPDSAASGSRVSESDDISLSLSSHGFKIGDMVWGKVKSHPWWPGVIYDESFASTSVRRTKHDGHVLVAFFGDSSYGWFDPSELIPYVPNFTEKSKQTTARSFLKAVDESVDEASRRSALGLSCMCRNPDNFRPTHVPGNFEVDVPGYERGGLYSSWQIERSREEFDPAGVLAFIRGIALAPAPSRAEAKEQKEIEMVPKIAQLLALRKAWYEEFDETYAQAFGVQLKRPTPDKLEDEPEKFARRVAPLSGPLVIAEAFGDKKKTKTKSYFTKASSLSYSKKKKKNNYLLKRRDHQVPTVADANNYFGQQQQPKLNPDPSLPAETRAEEVHDYVLQKRELPEVPKPISADPEMLKATLPSLPATKFPTAPVLKVVVESKQEPDHSNSVLVDHRSLNKDKIKKRPREEEEEEEDSDVDKEKVSKKKKKNKLQEIPMRAGNNAQLNPARTSSGPNVPSAPEPPELQQSLGPLELLEFHADLSALAMDPFHGVDRDAPSTVRHVFLKFRSLVYQKSLLLPSASESDSPDVQPTAPPPRKEVKEKREVAPKVKLGSLFKRSLDPTTKIGGKQQRTPQEDQMSTAKRLKKLNQLKSQLSSEKKAAAAIGGGGEKESSTTTTAAASAEKKLGPLLPLPPKKESPTNLILKFPPRSTLPSVANLKARFARFGPIVVEKCRVLWSTHTCKVQFKYKVDAFEAYNYVKDNNNLFGQIKVVYSVREVDLPGGLQSSSVVISSSQFRSSAEGGSGGGGGLTGQPRQRSGRPLKSILKKPGGDDDVWKENQRVKFRLATDDDSKSESAFKSASVVPPPKNSTFLPPPPPRSTTFPPQYPTLPRPMPAPPRMFQSQNLPPPSQLPSFRSVENHRPPMSTQYIEESHFHMRQQVQQYGGGSSSEGVRTSTNRRNTNIDISEKMLSLMNRCNEIVSGLKSLPGFVPFRPL